MCLLIEALIAPWHVTLVPLPWLLVGLLSFFLFLG